MNLRYFLNFRPVHAFSRSTKGPGSCQALRSCSWCATQPFQVCKLQANSSIAYLVFISLFCVDIGHTHYFSPLNRLWWKLKMCSLWRPPVKPKHKKKQSKTTGRTLKSHLPKRKRMCPCITCYSTHGCYCRVQNGSKAGNVSKE